jgi:hypothetical protein
MKKGNSNAKNPRFHFGDHRSQYAYFDLASSFGNSQVFFVKHNRFTFLLCCIAWMALLLTSPTAWAGAKKGDNLIVTFHMETDGNSNPKMVFDQVIAGKKVFFSRMADFSSRDVVAFSPFLADDKQTYGAVFQLRGSAKTKLENLSTANKGKLLCAKINGRLVDAVMIDKTIEDGMLVIWNGIMDMEVKEYDKVAPRIGAKKK